MHLLLIRTFDGGTEFHWSVSVFVVQSSRLRSLSFFSFNRKWHTWYISWSSFIDCLNDPSRWQAWRYWLFLPSTASEKDLTTTHCWTKGCGDLARFFELCHKGSNWWSFLRMVVLLPHVISFEMLECRLMETHAGIPHLFRWKEEHTPMLPYFTYWKPQCGLQTSIPNWWGWL